MTHKFDQLNKEKQQPILKASLKIFAEKGYEDASTNKIVEEAGISKGTLFYYFKNKKGLYDYLIDYALEIIKSEYIVHIDYETTDFIQRMENNSKIKYKYFQNYPEVNAFLTTVLYSELNNLSPEYQEKFQQLIQSTLEKINENQEIRLDLFKETIDPKKASRIIELSIEGYFNELIEKLKYSEMNHHNLEPLWDDFDYFLETLREVFYK